MENVFQDIVAQRNREGVTVLLSSHVLAEVESLADRLTIIRDGRTVATGTLEDLRDQANATVRATLRRLPAASDLTVFEEVQVDGKRLTGTVQRAQIEAAMKVLTALGLEALTVEPPSLESLFLRIYGEEDAA